MDRIRSPEAKVPARFLLQRFLVETHKAAVLRSTPFMDDELFDWDDFKGAIRSSESSRLLISHYLGTKGYAGLLAINLPKPGEDVLWQTDAFDGYAGISPAYAETPTDYLDRILPVNYAEYSSMGFGPLSEQMLECYVSDVEAPVKVLTLRLFHEAKPSDQQVYMSASVVVAPDLPPTLLMRRDTMYVGEGSVSINSIDIVERELGGGAVHILTDEQCAAIIAAIKESKDISAV